MEALAQSAIEYGAAAVALPGQSHCGDVPVLKSLPNGVLVAALDGLGHGEEAASAAEIARTILEEHAGEPPISLIDRCHHELRATRGVVMSLGWFDPPGGRLTWLGVGNVQGVLLRRGLAFDAAEEALLLRAGVVGNGHLPHLQAAVLPVSAGDTLVFATDGVAADFSRGLARSLRAQRAAEAILGQHRRATDDALVVVARFLGGGA